MDVHRSSDRALAPFLEREFFSRHFLEVARDLIGCELEWEGCVGRVVETEAYAVLGDEACHTFSRPSARSFVERHPPGTAYVYLNYGMHWLLNVLVKGADAEGIILIRALEPIEGIFRMQSRRGTEDLRALCSGPGKLSQALQIGAKDHQRDLCLGSGAGFRAAKGTVRVQTDRRIGISKAVDFPWRFLEPESRFVSVGLGKKKAKPESRLGQNFSPQKRKKGYLE